MENMKINSPRKFVRINGKINCPNVRVKKDGEHLGVMPTYQALDLAYREGLDLVEVAANVNPPIVEIMDYSKFKFEEKKKKKDQQSKAKTISAKEVRFRPVSGDHDIETKINQIKKFLEGKHPVLVSIVFKNREMMHREQGWNIMNRIMSSIENYGQGVASPKFEGSRLSVRLVPKS